MKYILVKAGERQLSVFSEFIELVNYQDVPQVGFYSLVPPGLRLVRNRTNDDRDCAFAVAHYVIDPAKSRQHEAYHKPINTALLLQAVETYDYVMVGMVTSTHLPSEEQRITNLSYIARGADGQLIDLETNQPVRDDFRVTFLTGLFGFIRIEGFPAYYMILNPNLIHVTDGFDFFHTQEDTLWMLINEHDETLRNRMFAPRVSDNARMIDSTILVDGTEFELNLFTDPCNVFRREDKGQLLDNALWTVTSNLNFKTSSGAFIVDAPVPGKVGFFELTFHGGHFFKVAKPSERLIFKYVVIPYDNS
jgi:hypothetical protein